MDDVRLREVESKLDRLLVQMDGLVERFGDHEEEQKTFRSKLHRVIYGNGSSDKGHAVRIDRLEQAQGRRDRMLWLVAGGILTGAVALFLG